MKDLSFGLLCLVIGVSAITLVAHLVVNDWRSACIDAITIAFLLMALLIDSFPISPA